MVKIVQVLRQGSRGLIFGAIIGFIVGKFVAPTTVDLSVIVQSQAIFDPLISAGQTALEFARTKVVTASTLIGAAIGFVLDFFTTPNTFFKRGR